MAHSGIATCASLRWRGIRRFVNPSYLPRVRDCVGRLAPEISAWRCRIATHALMPPEDALAQRHANDMARRNSLDHASFMQRNQRNGTIGDRQ
jgi:hypothetical protein